MCGIAGILGISGEPVSYNTIRAMCQAITHRGPDGEGVFIDCNLGLGHRRLAIIDLTPEAGQPMRCDNLTIAYNGEVYNYRELRRELQVLGHEFHSQSDTEVVLYAYKEWGTDCLHKFNGMFAFAIWDSTKCQLFLARDRYGVKPLYYYLDSATLVFASEIKAILKVVEPKVQLEAVKEYFTFQNTISDRTMFEGIKMLPAGHHLTATDGKIKVDKYWDFEFEPDCGMPFEEAASTTRRLLLQAVSRQLVSDVPVGSYLSGGIDSGSITAFASMMIPRLKTFTGGFDLTSVQGLESSFDEREPAELMSREFLTEHYEMVMHPGDMAHALPELVWHLEDLRMGMCYSNWYIAGLASRFVKVVLGGTGGDETFGGYPWRYSSRERTEDYYKRWQRLVPESCTNQFYSDSFANATDGYDTLDVFTSALEQHSSELTLEGQMYFEAKTFLHGLLIVEDKVSMARSLESRVPFLDNDLVDFALTLPSNYRINGLGTGKYVLRKALRNIVPTEILARAKQGFSSPDESWYKGKSMRYIREILLSPKALQRDYFNPKYISKVIDEHACGARNHRLLLWSLLCFEWWNRIFIEREQASL